MPGYSSPPKPRSDLGAQENEKKLMQKNKKLKSEKAVLIETNLKKEREIALLKEEDRKNKIWKTKVKELQNTIADLHKKESENGKLLQKNTTLLKENQELHNKYAIERMWREQKEKDLERFTKIDSEKTDDSQLCELRQKYENIKEQNEQNKMKIEKLSDMLLTQQKNLKETQTALNDERLSKQDLCEKMEMLKPLKDKMDYQIKENNKLAGEVCKYQEQIKTLREQTEIFKEELQAEQIQNKELLESLSIKNEVFEKIQKDLQSKDAQIAIQTQEAVKQRKINAELQREISRLCLQNGDLEKRTAAVALNKDREIAHLREELEKQEELSLQVTALRNQSDSLRGEARQAQTQLSESENENSALRKGNASLADKLSLQNAELEKMKTENCSVKDQMERTEKKLRGLEKEAKDQKMSVVIELTETRRVLSKTKSEKQELLTELEQCKELVVQYEKKLAHREHETRMLKEIFEELTQELKTVIEYSREKKDFTVEKPLSQLPRSNNAFKNNHQQDLMDEKAKEEEEKAGETPKQPSNLQDVIQILENCQWEYSYIICIRPHGWVYSYLCENTMQEEGGQPKHEERVVKPEKNVNYKSQILHLKGSGRV